MQRDAFGTSHQVPDTPECTDVARRGPDDAMHLVTEIKEMLGKVRAVLACDPRDECFVHHRSLPASLGKTNPTGSIGSLGTHDWARWRSPTERRITGGRSPPPVAPVSLNRCAGMPIPMCVDLSKLPSTSGLRPH